MLLEVHPSLGTFDTELIGGVVEAGDRLALRSVGEVHGPAYGLLDFVEQLRLGPWLLVRGNRDGRGAVGRHTGAVHDVDAEVHHRTTPGEFLVDAPRALSEDEAPVASHLHEWSEILLASETHQLFVVEVIVEAVADRELYFCCFAGGDHAVAISNRGG